MSPHEPGVIVTVLLAIAQEAAPPTAFTAAEAAARPEVVQRGLRFLMMAYSVVWVILAAYILSLSIRQRRMAQQIRRIRERLGL
jgi:CcmD family protein